MIVREYCKSCYKSLRWNYRLTILPAWMSGLGSRVGLIEIGRRAR